MFRKSLPEFPPQNAGLYRQTYPRTYPTKVNGAMRHRSAGVKHPQLRSVQRKYLVSDRKTDPERMRTRSLRAKELHRDPSASHRGKTCNRRVGQ